MSQPPGTLLEAASCGDIKRVSKFLQSIASRDDRDGNDNTECSAEGLFELDSQGYSAASWACCHDDLSVLTLLLEASSAFLTLGTHHGATPLHLVCLHKSMRCLDYLLALARQDDTPMLLDAVNDFQETPMHLAAGIGHVPTVERLIQAGASCLLTDQYGRSPHMVASQNGYPSCAAVIEARLSPHDKALLREEAIHATAPQAGPQQEQLIRVQTELKEQLSFPRTSTNFSSVQEKHLFKKSDSEDDPPLKPKLLSDVCSGASNRDSKSDSSNVIAHAIPVCRTALSKLVEFPGDVDAVRALLHQSDTPPMGLEGVVVDPAGKDMFGLSALHKFAAWNKPDLVQELVPYLNASDLNAPGGAEGFSALHHCVQMLAPQTLQILSSLPLVDLCVRDKKGRTYRELAHELGHSSLLDD